MEASDRRQITLSGRGQQEFRRSQPPQSSRRAVTKRTDPHFAALQRNLISPNNFVSAPQAQPTARVRWHAPLHKPPPRPLPILSSSDQRVIRPAPLSSQVGRSTAPSTTASHPAPRLFPRLLRIPTLMNKGQGKSNLGATEPHLAGYTHHTTHESNGRDQDRGVRAFPRFPLLLPHSITSDKGTSISRGTLSSSSSSLSSTSPTPSGPVSSFTSSLQSPPSSVPPPSLRVAGDLGQLEDVERRIQSHTSTIKKCKEEHEKLERMAERLKMRIVENGKIVAAAKTHARAEGKAWGREGGRETGSYINGIQPTESVSILPLTSIYYRLLSLSLSLSLPPPPPHHLLYPSSHPSFSSFDLVY